MNVHPESVALCPPCRKQILDEDVQQFDVCLQELSNLSLSHEVSNSLILVESKADSSNDDEEVMSITASRDQNFEEETWIDQTVGYKDSTLFANIDVDQTHWMSDQHTIETLQTTKTLQIHTHWNSNGYLNEVVTLMDTGSSSTLIRSDLLQTLTDEDGDIPMLKPVLNVKLKSASGNSMDVLGMTTLKFLMGGIAIQHDFFVLQELPFPVVLGMDFARANKVLVDCGSGRLTIYNDMPCTPTRGGASLHEAMVILQDIRRPVACNLELDTDITLNPGTVEKILIPFACNAYEFRASTGVVCHPNRSKKYRIVEGLVTCHNGMAAVIFNNLSNKATLIPRGTRVGTIELVEPRVHQNDQDEKVQLAEYLQMEIKQQMDEWKQFGSDCLALLTEEDWDHERHERHLAAPVDDIPLNPDPGPDVTKEELQTELQHVYTELKTARVNHDFYTQKQCSAKATRLLDRLVLFRDDDEDEEADELPASLSFKEGYAHLSDEQIDIVKGHLASTTRFFTKGKFPKTIRTQRPVVIELKEGAVPTTAGYRRLTTAEQQVIDEYVDRLISADVVEPCNGPWSSPILVVPKAGGGLRAVADLRKVNECIAKDCYPMPNVDECLDQLEGAKWFTKLDLSSAFWQLPLAERSRDCTAFMSRRRGLWRWKAMPMGYVNASACFQREIDAALGNLRLTCCIAYIDDVVVYSDSTLEDHMKKVQSVLRALTRVGFSGNPEKCIFAQKDLQFLGHVIRNGHVEPRKDRLEKLMEIRAPTSVKELKSFLGLASYYRRFITHFSQISAPLNELTKMDTHGKSRRFAAKKPWPPGTWTEEHERAFKAIKGAFLSNPKLALPRKHRRWRLATDASDVAMGAVLSQVSKSGNEYPISFLSRKLTDAEKVWDIWERELAAILWATTACRHHLVGNRFELITDSAVVAALASKDVPNRRKNWLVRLSQFDFFVTLKKGEQNRNADFFSRYTEDAVEAFDNREQKNEQSELQLNNIETAEADTELRSNVEIREYLKTQQTLDVQHLNIIRWLTDRERATGKKPEDLNKYQVIDGILTRERTFIAWKGKKGHFKPIQLICVPPAAVQTILRLFHGEVSHLGHLGINKTFRAITKHFTWKGLTKDVRKWIKACHSCLSIKRGAVKHRRYNLHMGQTAPMNRIAIDIVGPLTKTNSGHTHILTVYCPFSHWPEAYPLRTTKTVEIIKNLKHHVSRHGVPSEVLSDRGKNLLAEKMKAFLARVGSRKINTSSYKPSSNGSVENFHKYLAKSIAVLVNKTHTDWDQHLSAVLFAYRIAPLEGLDLSPYEILYGRSPRLPVDGIIDQGVGTTAEWTPLDHVEHCHDQSSIINPLVAENHLATFQKNRRNNALIKNKVYEPGTMVYVRLPKGVFCPKGGTNKFSRRNGGPYVVVRPVDKDRLVYALKHMITGVIQYWFVGRMIPAESWSGIEREENDDALPDNLRLGVGHELGNDEENPELAQKLGSALDQHVPMMARVVDESEQKAPEVAPVMAAAVPATANARAERASVKPRVARAVSATNRVTATNPRAADVWMDVVLERGTTAQKSPADIISPLPGVRAVSTRSCKQEEEGVWDAVGPLVKREIKKKSKQQIESKNDYERRYNTTAEQRRRK